MDKIYHCLPGQLPPTGTIITIRLPKDGELCPYTGLGKTKLKHLAIPCKANSHKPPVASISVKDNPTQSRGARLILWDSLHAHLTCLAENKTAS